MRKAELLRAAFVAALPEFARDPDRLVMFVDKGRLVARRSEAFGYEWRYTIRVEFHDFTGSPDAIAVPLLLWLRDHQPDLMMNFGTANDAIGFAADILDDKTWDVAIAFELSEAVALERTMGGWSVQPLPEPLPDDPLLDGALCEVPLGEIWLGDTLLLDRKP